MYLFEPNSPLATLLESSMFKSINQLTFSSYSYIKDNINDTRNVFTLSPKSLKSELINQLTSLHSSQELALHSTVIDSNGLIKHIPMLDFASNVLDYYHKNRLYKFLGLDFINQGYFFRSGKSFHFYYPSLMTIDELYTFWGKCLLVNEPHNDFIVDTRWIGHRLIAGCGALRLTNNSGIYLMSPIRVNI